MVMLGLLFLGENLGTRLRYGSAQDWKYIDSLRKREGNALGFIPKAAYESVLERRRINNRDRWRYQRILVTVDNNDLTGFCYYSVFSPMISVIQIVVQADARRWHRALLMIDRVEKEAKQLGKKGITARVAYDLESNFFWGAIGYAVSYTTTSTWLNQRESYCKRPLLVYEKVFENATAK